jgi:hypothetical protein
MINHPNVTGTLARERHCELLSAAGRRRLAHQAAQHRFGAARARKPRRRT